MMARPRRTLAERFHEKYIVHPTNGCWLWTGATDDDGHGRIRGGPPDQRLLAAHRVSYELHIGPIPAGLIVDPRCDMPRCVNPAHLQLLTQRQNALRSTSRLIAAHWMQQCLRGHDLSIPGSYYVRSDIGVRVCKACIQMRAKHRHHTMRAARRADAV